MLSRWIGWWDRATTPWDEAESRHVLCILQVMPAVILFAICLVDIVNGRSFAFMPTGPFVHGSLFFVVAVPLMLCAGALVAIRARGAWERAMPFIALVGGTTLMMIGHSLMETKSLASFTLYALPILGAAYSWRGEAVAIITGLMTLGCLVWCSGKATTLPPLFCPA